MPELNVVSDHIFTKVKSNALTNEEFAAFIKGTALTSFIFPVRTPQPIDSEVPKGCEVLELSEVVQA